MIAPSPYAGRFEPPAPVTAAELGARRRHRTDDLRRAGRTGPIPVAEPDPVEQLAGVLAVLDLGAVAVVVDADWPADVRRAALDAAAKIEPPGAPGLVVFTSGSGGTPKPVARTLRSWTASFPAFSELTGLSDADTVLIPGRLSASLFLFGAIHAATIGATVGLLPRWHAGQAARAAAGCTAAHVVPTMLAELAELANLSRSAVGSLRLAICAGAHLPAPTRAAAASADIRVVDYYGASELSFVAIRRDDSERLRPFPGVEIAVRDAVIGVRSPYLADGLATDAHGYATVGDHGVLHDDGGLTVLGRGDSVIISGGATVRPEGVEHVLRTSPDIGEVAVVGQPHDRLGRVVAAVVEPRPGATPQLAALRAAAARALLPADRPRLWYVTERLPRTRTGKVARADLAAALAAGTIDLRRLR